METEFGKSFLPKKAFDLFKNAETLYNEKGSFPNEALEALHSYFDEPFVDATELLEKSRISCYSTSDSLRKVYEISSAQEQHVVFENVNFCHCNFFKTRVLDSRSNLSCKHVLAVCLAKIMGKVRAENLTESVFEEYLNVQLSAFLDMDTQKLM